MRRPSALSTSAATIAVMAFVALSPGMYEGGRHLVSADDTFNIDLTDAIAFAGTQLEVLSKDVLTELGVFTDYTDTDGLWITVKDNGDPIDQTVCTSGMVAGMFWYQYALVDVDKEIWKTRAEFYLEGLKGVEVTDDNDLGFQVFDSFGLGYKLITSDTDKAAYKERVLTGANTLHDNRWAENIPAFWSWDDLSRRPEWERAVNIDMMMNMEILLWANENEESVVDCDCYAAKVEAHAEQTWIDIVREDNSSFHVADYDPVTGELVEQGTYQGYSDNSTWSRGQAWGIYGMVMVYRFRQKPRFLSYSIGLLEYWEDNIPDDLIPPSDFDAPDDEDNGKDSSASAIVASALFEIFTATEDANYLLRAQEYLKAIMSSDCYQPEATDGYQSILRRATSKWSALETGAVFGDYFFLEALWRYKTLAPSVLLFDEAEVTVNGGSSGMTAGRRRLSLRGGKYCELVYAVNKLWLKDPDCVPELRVSTDTVSSNIIEFTGSDLDNDVTVALLDTFDDVYFWFAVTLSNTANIPSSITLQSVSSDSVEEVVASPDGGWVAGLNKVSFKITAGAMAAGSWEMIESITVEFETSATSGGEDTDVVVEWLVVTNEMFV